MLDFIKESGLFGWLIALITLINVVNFIRFNIVLNNVQPEDGPRLRYSINGIVFWGGVCALIGFLGQYAGIYLSLNVVSQAEVISPNMVAMGLAISFTTTIMGMFSLLLSALGWFILHRRYRRISDAWKVA
jgi:hypothetical protein